MPAGTYRNIEHRLAGKNIGSADVPAGSPPSHRHVSLPLAVSIQCLFRPWTQLERGRRRRRRRRRQRRVDMKPFWLQELIRGDGGIDQSHREIRPSGIHVVRYVQMHAWTTTILLRRRGIAVFFVPPARGMWHPCCSACSGLLMFPRLPPK